MSIFKAILLSEFSSKIIHALFLIIGCREVLEHLLECRKEALWKIADTIRDESVQDLRTVVNNFLKQ